MSAPEEGKRHD